MALRRWTVTDQQTVKTNKAGGAGFASQGLDESFGREARLKPARKREMVYAMTTS